MVGVGKLLKQAQKMQQKMEEAQALLSEEIIEVSGGGGAVSIKISGQGEFKDFALDIIIKNIGKVRHKVLVT